MTDIADSISNYLGQKIFAFIFLRRHFWSGNRAALDSYEITEVFASSTDNWKRKSNE